jgi:hypothetical protein
MMADDVRIFISWSGATSLRIAQSLASVLRTASDRFELFISSEDIRSGQRWLTVVNEQLSQARAGLIIVTPDNQTRPGLKFEAGAIANAVDIPKARVIPILCGVETSTVDSGSPLRQFQMRELTKEGLEAVITDLASMAGIDAETALKRASREVGSMPSQAQVWLRDAQDDVTLRASQAAMMEELLILVRGQFSASTEDDGESTEARAALTAVREFLASHDLGAAATIKRSGSQEVIHVAHTGSISRPVMYSLEILAWHHRQVPIYFEHKVQPATPPNIDAADREHMKY